MVPADPSLTDESPRILVVDDEKVIREILTDFLAMEGFGASAPAEQLMEHFGFTAERIVDAVKSLL